MPGMVILLDRDKPQEARELVAAVLPTAEDHPFLVHLKMDDADALYEQNDNRKVSISAYLKIAGEHDDHPLAAKAQCSIPKSTSFRCIFSCHPSLRNI